MQCSVVGKDEVPKEGLVDCLHCQQHLFQLADEGGVSRGVWLQQHLVTDQAGHQWGVLQKAGGTA